jgi:beta-barrel assembly-enhancing protease
MNSKVSGLIWVLVIAGLGAGMGWGIPRLAGLMPWSFEQKLSKSMMSAMMPGMQVCESKPGSAALLSLVGRIFPLLEGDAPVPLQVQVIEGETINAFAALGGKIFIYDGLLRAAHSPEELAGVLAHEIEHVKHRHVFQGMFVRLLVAAVGGGDVEWMGALLNLKFSRRQEDRADRDGLSRLRTAEVDVKGFADFFQREASSGIGGLEPPEMISDHPAASSRAQLVQEFAGGPVRPILAAPEWANLQKICK